MNCLRARFATFLVLLVAGLLPHALPAQNFTFDFSNQSGDLNDNEMYVVFGGGWTGTLGENSLETYNGSASSVYSFANITAAGGFNITNAAAGTAYILYGNTSLANFEAANISTPAPFGNYRYSFTEYNFDGTLGHSDITEIDQFGGSVAMSDYAPNGNLSQSFYNTLGTGDAMRSIINNTGLALNSSAVITTGPNGTGSFVSIIGPSKITSNTPYPSYDSYLAGLHTSGSNSWITNNTPHDGPIGMSNLVSNTTAGNQTWVATYSFNATVNANKDIVWNGSISFVGAANTTGANITYNGLYMIMPHDSNQSLAIYLQNPSASTIYGNLSTANVTVNGNVDASYTPTWGNIGASYGIPVSPSNHTLSVAGNVVIQLQSIGDVEEGIATGFPGSTSFGNISSALWWENATSAYTNGAQLVGSGNYNTFGVVNFAGSANSTYDITTGNLTSNITGGVIYTSPYDDRFNSNLMIFGAGNTVVVSALNDGNMVVPEPAVDALLTAAAVLSGAFLIRRSSRTRLAPCAEGSRPLMSPAASGDSSDPDRPGA
jgi:hypothetical protein